MTLAGVTSAGQVPNPTIAFAAARDVPHESVTWDQPIELGGKRGKRLAVAREEQKATELDLAALERQVRRRTREAFFRSLILRAETGQARAALELAQRTQEIVQQRFEAGAVAELEVLQTKVELARAEADFNLAKQSELSADAQLAALLGRKPAAAMLLSGAPEQVPAAPALEQITALAMQSSTEVARTTQELRIEQRRLSLAKAQRVPNLDLMVGADLNAPPDFQAGPRGQVSVQLPLFYHGQGEVALSNAKMEFLRLALESQRLNVSAAVAAAYYDYGAKRQQAEQYRDRILPQSVKLEEMSEDSYSFGKSNLLTLLDAQRRLNDVRKAYLDSLFAAQSSFAALEESVGAPLD